MGVRDGMAQGVGCALIAFLLLSASAVAVLFLCCVGLALSGPALEKAAQDQQKSPPTKVTYANYARVQNGMHLDEVKAILGDRFEVLSDSDIAGIRTVMLSWKAGGLGGGNCNVTFQNGQVVMKAQAFLK